MKHVVIGDLHGRNVWKEVDFAQYQKAVFLGDYVDSFTRTDAEILQNLKEIISLKKTYPEKIVLLWGNHDVQYLHYPKYFCPGFRPSMQRELTFLFRTNRHLFRMAYQSRNTIFTHAGITNIWWRSFIKSIAASKAMTVRSSIANLLNAVELSEYRDILYTTSPYRTGQNENGGPLWADYMETFHDALNGYHQFVGHSAMSEMKHYSWHGKSITYLDVLHKQLYFHVVHL
jgi:predicted phosphodiesterase